jgi:hypothetical protein
MVKFYEKINFKPERDNNDLPNTSPLLSYNKEVQIQEYTNKNGQYSSDVQHQQEVGSQEFIPHFKEDLEIIRKKLLNIKGSAYPREDKCDNGQTKSIGNEWKLSSGRKSVSKDSKSVEILPKSKSVRIQKEQINKNICVSKIQTI